LRQKEKKEKKEKSKKKKRKHSSSDSDSSSDVRRLTIAPTLAAQQLLRGGRFGLAPLGACRSPRKVFSQRLQEERVHSLPISHGSLRRCLAYVLVFSSLIHAATYAAQPTASTCRVGEPPETLDTTDIRHSTRPPPKTDRATTASRIGDCPHAHRSPHTCARAPVRAPFASWMIWWLPLARGGAFLSVHELPPSALPVPERSMTKGRPLPNSDRNVSVVQPKSLPMLPGKSFFAA
jgi:hypothetical protein